MWNNLHNTASSIPIARYTVWELHITCHLCLFAFKITYLMLLLRLMHSRGRGVTSVWQTQGKLSHQNAMLAKQCALQIIAGMSCQIFSSRRKNTWVVASKYTIVHTTQCTTRPVMMRMKCTCECSFVHAGGRAADTGKTRFVKPETSESTKHLHRFSLQCMH